MIEEKPLSLTVKCDWIRIRNVYDKLIDNYAHGFFYNLKYIPTIQLTACDIGRHGRLAITDTVTDHKWFTWSGRLLESMIPWAKNFRTLTSNAGIMFHEFAFHRHFGDISAHIDGKQDNLIIDPRNHCNLNFVIICDDTQSKSYFEHPDGIHYYSSREQCAYLIDTSVKHWVKNNARREVFQVRFHSSYQKVKEFFGTQLLILE